MLANCVVTDVLETATKRRGASIDQDPLILTDIYKEDVNIVIWQRALSEKLSNVVQELIETRPKLQTAMTVTPQDALARMKRCFDGEEYAELAENIAELVDMFCCLFGAKSAGMRLATLDRAMCPRFHVDKVPCRLVTTYQGLATELLPHQAVNRERLGAGNLGKPDNKSGLYQTQSDIQQLSCGDVALLKGELWEGNENAGLVHRSPMISDSQLRLVLTLDIVAD